MLPIGFFNGLGNQEHLTIAACWFKTLPDGLFLPLARLQLLNLYKNDELVLNANTFSGLGNLRWLKLDNCDNLSIDVFIHFPNFQELFTNNISENLTKQLKAKFSNITIIK